MEESILITKKLDLDMAHALDNYDGKCRFIHGHTFHFSVTLKGFIINDENDPKNGMVMDFGELKTILKEEIADHFDHSLVLKDSSPYAIITKVLSERINLLPFQPTCENLLGFIVDTILKSLPPSLELHSVKLYETATSYGEWFAEDNR